MRFFLAQFKKKHHLCTVKQNKRLFASNLLSIKIDNPENTPLQFADLQGSCFSQVTYNISITSERDWTIYVAVCSIVSWLLAPCSLFFLIHIWSMPALIAP